MMLVILIAVVALAVAVVRTTEPDDRRRGTAQTILDRRLARGELDVEDHRARSRQVSQQAQSRGHRWVVAGMVAVAGVTILAVAINDRMARTPMMQMMEGTDMMSGMMGTGWLVMLLVLAVVVGVIVWAVARLSPADRGTGDEARRLLDERYARGELDDDEYARRREALGR